MSNSLFLKLPLLAPQQAQKHVTHNEALLDIDRLVQLAVLDRHLAAPPTTPAEGDRYIVGPAATGAWATRSGQIAVWADGVWNFHAPNEGWLAWIADEDLVYAFDGSQWQQQASPTGALLFGINSTADTSNRLSVASAASLFNHAGNGHQLKLNKALATDTGSILFQTGFSGRAELGLTGDDDFRFKVSATGSTWKDALRLDRTTGRVSFPSGGVREQLSAARTYFVAPTGSDTNAGLTAGTPFATVQKAIDTVAGLDNAGFDVTIQLADGTYGAGVLIRGAVMGSGLVTLKGNAAAPQNVVLSRTSGDAVTVRSGTIRLEALTLQTSGALGHGLNAELGSVVLIGTGLRFAACIGHHVLAATRAVVRFESGAAIAIVGGASSHLTASAGQIDASTTSWTLTGSPVFATFAAAAQSGTISLAAASFSGVATGTRYAAQQNGVIATGTGNATLLPGSIAGTLTTGGVYV